MTRIGRPGLRITVVICAMAGLGLADPAAAIARETLIPPLASDADAEARSVAAEDPASVLAAASLCGAGYELQYAERLPEANNRKGTVFLYTKYHPTYGHNSCALFDNNTGTTKYMKLKLCENRTVPVCDQDAGNFSQYAGPVHLANGFCSKYTAIMKNTSSSTTAIIDRVETVPPCG